jgi:hypothetical protein
MTRHAISPRLATSIFFSMKNRFFSEHYDGSADA